MNLKILKMYLILIKIRRGYFSDNDSQIYLILKMYICLKY